MTKSTNTQQRPLMQNTDIYKWSQAGSPANRGHENTHETFIQTVYMDKYTETHNEINVFVRTYE